MKNQLRARTRSLCRTFGAVLCLLFIGSGCLQLETNIVLHSNGSGTITERVNFTRKLLDLAKNAGPELQLEPLLTREAALSRMKHMGKGISLVSHKTRNGAGASRESITVFKIPNLADFTYMSPFVPRYAQTTAPKFKTMIYPTMADHPSWYYPAGLVCAEFRPVYTGKAIASTNLPSRSPLASQALRDLRPVFQDLLGELKIKITFESYAPIKIAFYRSGFRDANAKTHKVDLIDIAPGRDLDAYGFPLLDNEEVVVDLLRWDLKSPWVAKTVQGWSKNKTLPALHAGGGIYFKPCREYFDKFFKGKKLKTHNHGMVPASWKALGWTPVTKKSKP